MFEVDEEESRWPEIEGEDEGDGKEEGYVLGMTKAGSVDPVASFCSSCWWGMNA